MAIVLDFISNKPGEDVVVPNMMAAPPAKVASAALTELLLKVEYLMRLGLSPVIVAPPPLAFAALALAATTVLLFLTMEAVGMDAATGNALAVAGDWSGILLDQTTGKGD